MVQHGRAARIYRLGQQSTGVATALQHQATARSPPFDDPPEPSVSARSVGRAREGCADAESDFEAHDNENPLRSEPSESGSSLLRSSVLAASSRLAAAGLANAVDDESLDEVDEVIGMLSDDILFEQRTNSLSLSSDRRSASDIDAEGTIAGDSNTTTVGLRSKRVLVKGAAAALLGAEEHENHSRHLLRPLPWQQNARCEDGEKSQAEKSGIDLGFGAIDNDICSLLELLD